MKKRWLNILPGGRPWSVLLLLMAAAALAFLAGCEDKGGEEAPTEFSTGREKRKTVKSERVQVKTKGKVIK